MPENRPPISFFDALFTALLGIILLSTGSWFLQAGTLAQFRSPLGDIEVELYDQDKPTAKA